MELLSWRYAREDEGPGKKEVKPILIVTERLYAEKLLRVVSS